jgi:flavin-binding protein dodecin
VAKAKSKKTQSKGGASVYRITELVGTSAVSWEDAVKRAVATAAGSLRDLRIADIIKLDVKVDGGKVVAYRARVALSFKYDA